MYLINRLKALTQRSLEQAQELVVLLTPASHAANSVINRCIAPFAHLSQAYTHCGPLRWLFCLLTPLLMAANSAQSTLVSVQKNFFDPHCEGDQNPSVDALGLLTVAIGTVYLFSNTNKFIKAGLVYQQRYGVERIATDAEKPVSKNCCTVVSSSCEIMAALIMATANALSFTNVITTHVYEKCQVERDIAVILLLLGIILQLPLLLCYFDTPLAGYFFKGTAQHPKKSDALLALTYAGPNTTQYTVDRFANLAIKNLFGFSVLYGIACLGIAQQYYGILAAKRVASINPPTVTSIQNTDEESPLLQNEIKTKAKKCFLTLGFEGNCITLLMMGVGVAVKTRAGWESLHNLLTRINEPTTVLVLNSLFALVNSNVQMTRVMEIA